MNEMSPSASYYEPPSFHEVCKCESCHELGEHNGDELIWAKFGCDGCYDHKETH